MLLAPSDIQFLRDGAANLTDADSDTLAELSKGFAESAHLPKLQVAGKDGAWFALNNSSLHVVRELERQGKCGRVKVDVVPLSKVPTSVQLGMIAESQTDTEDKSAKSTDPSRETKHGYEKLPVERTIEENNQVSISVEEETASYSSSDCSDCDEEMSESDDGDEDLTCNVCDRSFATSRLLAQHQQKKRHFGCSVCESLFPSLMALEHHKECLDHWSEDEGNSHDSDDDDDNDVIEVQGKGDEETERLL